MHKQERLKLLFIVNPVSGGKEKQDWEARIRQFFKGRPESINFYLLTGKNDMVSVKHHMETVRPDRILAVGGDGTVKMLTELLMGTSIPLGIIPAGSANGMAKELKIPLAVEEALQVITDGVCKELDAIRINEKEVCLHLGDIGLNAMLVKYFENSGTRGMLGYGKAVFRVLWEKQMMEVTIRTDEQKVVRKAYMVVIANARTYGTGAVINPEGEVDDGLFEVVVVRKLNLFELLKMLITHRPFDPGRIEVFQTRSLEMTTRRKAYFQVDGEYLGRTTMVRAKILPGAVHIMMPAAAAP